MRDAVLLAGGLGTRLIEVSDDRPKPLVQVGGRPFVEHVLDLIVDAGCARVVMAVAYRWEMLRDHLGDTYRGVHLDWSVETNPLGTGGALRFSFEAYSLDAALALNADTLFRVDLRDLEHKHVAARAQATLALREVDDVCRFGAVELDAEQRIVAFREKGDPGPGLINGGVYIIDSSIFDLRPFPNAFSLERDLFASELRSLKLLGVSSRAYFVDIGIPADLERARGDLRGG